MKICLRSPVGRTSRHVVCNSQWCRPRRTYFLLLDYLTPLGITFDNDINNENGKKTSGLISTPTSKVDVFVVATDEEMMIAKEVKKLFNEKV